jgi:hypothetical protein
LLFFHIGPGFPAPADLDFSPPTYTSCVAGMTKVCTSIPSFYWLRWDLMNSFSQDSLEPQP